MMITPGFLSLLCSMWFFDFLFRRCRCISYYDLIKLCCGESVANEFKTELLRHKYTMYQLRNKAKVFATFTYLLYIIWAGQVFFLFSPDITVTFRQLDFVALLKRLLIFPSLSFEWFDLVFSLPRLPALPQITYAVALTAIAVEQALRAWLLFYRWANTLDRHRSVDHPVSGHWTFFMVSCFGYRCLGRRSAKRFVRAESV